MFRPVTSRVSAVSGCVAKGHQAMHHVSCSPSKIPYGGFSPVRLQTGIGRRPSRSSAYTPSKSRSRRGAFGPWSGRTSASNRNPSPLTLTIPSRGPWLARGLFCPAGSRLTMASSEPLVPSHWLILIVFVSGSLPLTAGEPEGPQFTPRVCSFVPPSLPRRTSAAARDCCLAAGSGLRRSCSGSASAFPRSPVLARLFTRLQSSLYAAARRIARPTPERTFTLELSPPKSPRRGVEYDYAGKQSIPAAGLSPARHAALWAAHRICRIYRIERKSKKKLILQSCLITCVPPPPQRRI